MDPIVKILVHFVRVWLEMEPLEATNISKIFSSVLYSLVSMFIFEILYILAAQSQFIRSVTYLNVKLVICLVNSV